MRKTIVCLLALSVARSLVSCAFYEPATRLIQWFKSRSSEL